MSRVLRPLPISGLAIGAMAPDFEYLFRLAVYSRIGHTTAGMILFTIPVAFVAWIVFSRVVRPALVELLPAGLAQAMRPPVQSLALGLAAVAIGALSHIAWDGITHRRGWTPAILPFLLTPVVPGLPLYRLLQHLSSAIGAAAIAIWISKWVRRQPAEARRFAPGQRRRSIAVVVAILAISCLAGITNAAFRQPVRNLGDWLALFVVGGMAAFVLALLTFGISTRARQTKKDEEKQEEETQKREGQKEGPGATIAACPE